MRFFTTILSLIFFMTCSVYLLGIVTEEVYVTSKCGRNKLGKKETLILFLSKKLVTWFKSRQRLSIEERNFHLFLNYRFVL